MKIKYNKIFQNKIFEIYSTPLYLAICIRTHGVEQLRGIYTFLHLVLLVIRDNNR